MFRIRSLIAIFLLLFVAIDLGFASACKDELVVFQVHSDSLLSFSEMDKSQEQYDADLVHECFCCCQHIRHEEHVKTLVEFQISIGLPETQKRAPYRTPTPLDHPPKAIPEG